MILIEKAKKYANDVINGEEITTKYVKKQCEWFLRDLEEQNQDDFAFYFDEKILKKIEGILALLHYATGLNVVGLTVLEGIAGFQAFFLVNVFGWRYKDDPKKMRYREGVLFIPRKNGKTWLIAIIMILLLLLEDNYSEFYSICVDRELAGETKKAISQVIEASPRIAEYFVVPKTLSGKIVCKITKSFYQARTSDASRNNAIRPAGFCADEVGAFKDFSNIAAMQSGQLSVRNPLTFKMTTAYANSQSIMLDELDYIKKVFDGVYEDKRLFALLYYSEPENLWSDLGISQANPLRISENYEEIKKNRQKALDKPAEREEFLTKHVNHWLPTNSGESYVDIDDLRKCKITDFDWTGRDVWIGLDMAMSNDNCSFSMVCEENLKIYADSYAFVPVDRIEEKNRYEKINYWDYINSPNPKCFSCGDLTIDYGFIEDMVMNIEEKYKVNVRGVAYDRYNCLSTAQKLEKSGMRVIEAKQHSSVLHPATKLLKEKILSQEFFYLENKLLEINFINARCLYDTNLNQYVNKKKSNGKVDMVVSMINAIFILSQDVIFNPDMDWTIQVI